MEVPAPPCALAQTTDQCREVLQLEAIRYILLGISPCGEGRNPLAVAQRLEIKRQTAELSGEDVRSDDKYP